MDANQVENLLQAVEGSNLDFKSEIDLDSKRGKADFLVEVLGLANTPDKPSFLILGVQDKPRKAIGIADSITEERLQKLIADNCRPPITCIFESAAFERKRIGILTILGTNKPYVLKKEHSFSDDRGKQHTYSDKAVFIRRGSTGDIANTDEIVEMILEHQTNGNTADSLESVERELSEISSKLYHIDNSIDRLVSRDRRERAIEYIFLGIVSGLLIGFAQQLELGWEISIIGILLSTFWISVFASALKLVRFGWIRSILVSSAISIVFVIVSVLFDAYARQVLSLLSFPASLVPIWSGIKGMLGGVGAAYLGRGEYEYD